ncbi:MAG: acyl-ACP--UDP-N-acetylglucosamine O-acyltransferase [Calditrichaeota bacterium]|nr:MAG: acyl-ACP--UDP-N-acetylglucosamine O-acyltransferase [Calditrichota bacterium]MBL1204238.1 acyl-ACP--UDP-N-acetylglucosamine O-acyltransferase [Calditrichota bacterium]NOG44068.1 acyl-ACP--UDP-N-acetylglucosamine O-acyltransferase [Calditrichota bacterium]
MTQIHPSAIVSENADIGNDVSIGPYSIIENDVKINDGCQIASHVLISSGTELGKGCKISKGAVLGTDPQDLKFEDEKTFLQIGNNTTIREFATLNRATTHSYYTRIGDNCLIMAYAHVAHDCQIGNNVVLANSVNLAGHVIIEDFVGIGGLTPVHQFVKIGTQSFIGGGLRIPKDVPPYILAMGEPLKFAGLNKIGMQRRGFSADSLSAIREAYKILYRQNNTTKEAIKLISEKFSDTPEVMHLVDFLKSCDRGIIR